MALFEPRPLQILRHRQCVKCRNSQGIPPIVLFEDTNPLRRSNCKMPVRPVVARIIPGCQLQTRDPQRRADGRLATRASNGFRPLVQHTPFSRIQGDIANSIQLCAAALEQRCLQLAMPGFAKRRWQKFRRLVHGTLEQ